MSSLLSAQEPTPATPNDPKAWALKPPATVSVPSKVSKGSEGSDGSKGSKSLKGSGSLNVTAGGPKAGKGRVVKGNAGKGRVGGVICVSPTAVPKGYFRYNGKLLPNSLRPYIRMSSDETAYTITTCRDGEYHPNCDGF